MVESLGGRKKYVEALHLADSYDYAKLEDLLKLAMEEVVGR